MWRSCVGVVVGLPSFALVVLRLVPEVPGEAACNLKSSWRSVPVVD